MKLFIILSCLISFMASAQIINFSDITFKQMLLDHGTVITGNGVGVIDLNGDGEIQVSEANTYTGTIYLDDANTGTLENVNEISNFTEIQSFHLINGSVDSLDISNCSEIRELYLVNQSFWDFNYLNPSDYLFFKNVQLSNPGISGIGIVFDTSSEVDSVYIENSEVSLITAYYSSITKIELVNCATLYYLDVAKSNVESLDLTSCENLTACFAENCNDLIYANIANGNNELITTAYFHNTPNLTCITVDDPGYSNNQSAWTKDVGDSYSPNCLTIPCLINFSDQNLENRILEHGYSVVGDGIGIIDLNNDDFISCDEAFAYQGSIDLSNTFVDSNLVGLEYFVNINSLDVSSNDFDDLSLPNTLNNIKKLDLRGNNLTYLGNSNQNAISSYNSLSYLDVSNNMLTQNLNFLNGLDTLYANDNNLVEMDLSGNFDLRSLNLSNNNLEELSIIIGANYNELLDVNLLNNSNLFCVDVDDSIFSDMNWIQKDLQTEYSENCSGSVSTASINKEDQRLNLSVYPNPASQSITINNMLYAGIVKLYNSMGKLVLSTTKSEIDISNLEKGIYLITIENEVQNVKSKLIIQ